VADVLRIQHLEKIVKMAKDIKTVNGYLNTIRTVNEVDTSVEELANQLPAINVNILNLNYLNATTNEAGKLIKIQRYLLDVYWQGNSDIEKQRIGLKLLADLEIRFHDRTIGGNSNYRMTASAFNLEDTAFVCLPADVNQWAVPGYTHMSNFTYEMDVHFRQSLTDPTTKVP